MFKDGVLGSGSLAQKIKFVCLQVARKKKHTDLHRLLT